MRMLEPLHSLLNRITMYRLMLYFLLGLWIVTIFLSLGNYLPYNPAHIAFSGIYLVVVCYVANYLFSKIVGAKTNVESAAITALILTLIVGPLPVQTNLFALTFIGGTAMASKYFLAIRKKHIFNPVAIAVVVSAFAIGRGASWWIGSTYTLPFILLGGVLVLIKIRRFLLIASFLAVHLLATILLGNSLDTRAILAPSVWFFVVVMLIEPLTSPPTKNKQAIFGGFVAGVYNLLPEVVSGYPYALETSLLVGNMLNFLISAPFNIVLRFKNKIKVAKNTWQFNFEPMSDFSFIPGQFLEWTFPHEEPDSRGVRRYFTISSAPAEEDVSITMRVFEDGSSFKSALLDMNEGDEIIASSPQGDFTLPKDQTIPLVFMAGGIGITPFRSMARHLLEKNEKRDIILFYSNSSDNEIAFKKLFDSAKKVGMKTIYINTKKDGYVDEQMIKENVPDYQKRVFYVSGPRAMVDACKKLLSNIQIKEIRTDFFPGYSKDS